MKKVIMILLMVTISAVGVFLTGCDKNYDNIEITASYRGQENGHLSLEVDEEATIVFSVTNLPKDTSARLFFRSDSSIITTPEVLEVDEFEGTNTISIKAISAGSATLQAIAEGGNMIEVKIVATLTVEDFALKSDAGLFAVRGTNNPKVLDLSSDLFNFYPAETNQKQLKFHDVNANEITSIDPANYLEAENVTVFASSPYLSKELEMRVQIIDEIGQVNTFESNEGEELPLISMEQADDENQQTDIMFITNRSYASRKTLKVVVNSNTSNLLRVDRKVITESVLQVSEFDILRTYQENGNTVFEFEFQSLQEGKTKVEFNVYYLGYSGYTVTRTFDVQIQNAPDEIRLNDITQENNITQILFDGAYSTVSSSQYLSIIPSSAIYDRIQIEYDLTGVTTQENSNPNINDYINFTVNGSPIGDELSNLTQPIVAKGVRTTGGNLIYLVIKVYWGEGYDLFGDSGFVEYRLPFEVKTGASALLLQEEYSIQGGIYLENNGQAQIFEGLYITQIEAYTSNLEIIPLTQGAALFASVEEVETQITSENSKIIPLRITPLSVGQGKWRIILPNGIYKDIIINVTQQVTGMRLDYDEYASSASTLKQYDQNNSLTSLGLKLVESEGAYKAFLQLEFFANPSSFNFANINLYSFETQVYSNNQTTNTFDEITKILTVETDINGFSGEVFMYNFVINKVEDFKLLTQEDVLAEFGAESQEYVDFLANNVYQGFLDLTTFVPIEELSFSQKEVNLYSESHLGINYKDLAKTNVELTFNPTSVATVFENWNFDMNNAQRSIELSSSVAYSVDSNYLYINNYGIYNFSTGELKLDVSSTTYETFYIYATVNYYNDYYTAALKVNPIEYIGVSGVRLSNYIDNIYLDPTHPSQDVFAYVVPEDAIHQDLRYTFEPDSGQSAQMVRIENSQTGIKILYNEEYAHSDAAEGGYLVITPMANITDPSVTPANALKIRVRIGTGSEENPFRISTADEFAALSTSGTDKHYVIQNTIDLSTVAFNSISEFSGSIDGLGVGKIIGVSVDSLNVDSDNGYAHAGLFEKLLTGAKIKNITIAGSININVSENVLVNSYIGLVAGEIESGAMLSNVTVQLDKSKVVTASAAPLYIGGIAGRSIGDITTNVGSFITIPGTDGQEQRQIQNYSMIVMNGEFDFSYTIQTPQNQSFFGGVVGVNEGSIERTLYDDIKMYNNDIYAAIVDMHLTGATAVSQTSEYLKVNVGAFAGKNVGVIRGVRNDGWQGVDPADYTAYIKAEGMIESYQANNSIGGLVGMNVGNTASIERAISRVLLRSLGSGNSVTAYLGGMFGYNDEASVSNSIVQALEDGNSIGYGATLIYSRIFGLTEGDTPMLNGKVNVFGYDKDSGPQGPVSGDFSLSAEYDNSITLTNVFALESQTYVGGVDEGSGIPEGKRELIESVNTFATLNNYYGDMLVGTKGYMFQPVDAGLVFDLQTAQNIMQTESGIKMAYMHYYEAENQDEQDLINSYNIKDLPFIVEGEVDLFSFDTNIISISNTGKLIIRDTGIVKIKILSTLNAKISQDVYIYVVNAVTNYNLYVSSTSSENLVTIGQVVKIHSNQTLSLIVKYYGAVDLDGYSVGLVAGNDYTLINTYDYETAGIVPTVDFEKVGAVYALVAYNADSSVSTMQFNLQPTLKLQFNNQSFESSDYGLLTSENIIDSSIYSRFVVEHTIGVTRIDNTISELQIEPNDSFDYDLTLITDDFDDNLQNNQTKLENNYEQGEYFELVERQRQYQVQISNQFPESYANEFAEGEDVAVKLNIVQTINNNGSIQTFSVNQMINIDYENKLIKLQKPGAEYAEVLNLNMSDFFTIYEDTFTYSYEFSLYTKDELGDYNDLQNAITSYIKLNQIKYSLLSNFSDYNLQDYEGTYYINFNALSNTEIVNTLTVNVASQTVSEIIISSFEGSQAEDINSGAVENDFMDPQAENPNHLRVQIFPDYSDYDYVEIINETEDISAVITWIDEEGSNKLGALLVPGGIRLNKSDIEEYNYFKYATSSYGVVNGQVLTFAVNVYKDKALVYRAQKQITIKFSKDVTFDIVNKNTLSDINYLTRGTSYSFEISSNGYLEEEIFITTSRNDLIDINKAGRTITVTSANIVYPHSNITATISIYGSKTVGGEVVQSSPDVQSFTIVDFFIINSDEYSIVKNGSNGIVPVGLGNSYKLDTQFLNGLTVSYNDDLTTIVKSINTLEESITQNGVWEYQIGSLNEDGTYSYSQAAWNIVDDSLSSTQTDGLFTISIVENNYLVSPLKATDYNNPAYRFRLTYGYEYLNGLAMYSENKNQTQTEFCFNVYQISSIDTPTPIYTYEELENMGEGSYYILMNDIELPSNFSPITTKIGGLDGNGNKIIMKTNFSFDAKDNNWGLFGVIYEGTLVRNLEIQVQTVSRLIVSQASSVGTYIGLLAGQNSGMITNVFVNVLDDAAFRVVFDTTETISSNYVAGLVGTNSGYITNSRAILNITTAANLSGFVGVNSGKISSSYVDKSLLINTSQNAENKTAGFVLTNGVVSDFGGRIINSYVSGLHEGVVMIPMYANSTSRVVRSSTEAAGFIYENNGLIENSYSDIPVQTSSTSAGFVFVNNGTIKNTYSTSSLKNNSQESYGYVYDNSLGTLENNFYLTDVDVNYSINTSNSVFADNELKELTKEDFSQIENFETFLFTSSGQNTKGIWFMPNLTYESQFNNKDKTYVIGKPEIIAANLVAVSQMDVDLDRTVQDEDTGEITYYYNNVGAYAQGSIYNPYIVISAQDLENKIYYSSSADVNTNYYRLVTNIIYGEENVSTSKLYNTIFVGDLEGNGMEISGYIIDSSESVASAGLFAKIGNGSSEQGTVKNLTLKPKYINMPNAISVGSLAGTLDSGVVFNVIVDGFEYSNNGIVVLGKNIVGGIVGRAINNFKMYNVASSISTNSTYRSPVVLDKTSDAENRIGSYFLFRTHRTNTLSLLSYSGAVAGVIAGDGSVTYVQTNGIIASISEFAGLMFGGVGSGVVVEKAELTLVQGQFIQPAVYGGLVAGESYGTLKEVDVTSTNDITNLFKTIPFTPTAIGGVVGLMGSSQNLATSTAGGGKLIDVNLTLNHIDANVNIIGGLVGELIGGVLAETYEEETITLQQAIEQTSSINNSSFTGSITGVEIVGGIIGQVRSMPTADIGIMNTMLIPEFLDANLIDVVEGASTDVGFTLVNNSNVSGGSFVVSNDIVGSASVGGIVGKISLLYSSNASLNIFSSNNQNQIVINSNIYGDDFDIYAGGIVGCVTKAEVESGDDQGASASNLYLADAGFYSRIILNLKDLKQNTTEALTTDSAKYKIYFGKLVANQEISDDYVQKFFVSGTNVTFPNNETIFEKVVEYDEFSNYMLLEYTKDGELKQFVQDPEGTGPFVFKQLKIGEEND